ncbi:XPG/Rad2 endonuclease, partial [Corchorus capsularis]
MGVGGNFWELLKPYARQEGFDFLRDKRVAVDLSYWIVQHETAIKNQATNPHLRLTFFRTINLISKELLELMGMPVLKAKGEAEALCAQLNKDGYVDACITADSDAFLFGATCVIKCLRPNSKEPIECYRMSDIEAGLGLKRKHLIAISLLVVNDHDLKGVQGIGLDKALRFVRKFSEDEILDKLCQIGKGDLPLFQDGIICVGDVTPCLDDCSTKPKQSHCSFRGHPGSKKSHLKLSCEYCLTDGNVGCLKKSPNFKCNCSSCDKVRKEKDQKKHDNWWIKVCNKITMEPNFPNDEIIEMYMCNNHAMLTGWSCIFSHILIFVFKSKALTLQFLVRALKGIRFSLYALILLFCSFDIVLC